MGGNFDRFHCLKHEEANGGSGFSLFFGMIWLTCSVSSSESILSN